METCLDVIATPCREGGRDQGLAALEGEGDRHAAAAAGGGADVYRGRLQLCRADRRGRGGRIRMRSSASSMRSRRRLRRRSSALARGGENEFFDILAPTVPLSRHIFKAPTRFYKTGVVFLAWLNGLAGSFRHGGRAGERAVAGASGRVVPAGGQGGGAARPGAGGGADGGGAGGRGVDAMVEGLSINLATVRAQWECGRRWTAACGTGSRRGAVARPGGGDRAGARRRGWCGTRACG